MEKSFWLGVLGFLFSYFLVFFAGGKGDYQKKRLMDVFISGGKKRKKEEIGTSCSKRNSG